MRRRDLLALLDGTAIVPPVGALSQQKPMAVVGYLQSASAGPSAPYLAGLRQGLSEAGYIEGQNLTIEYRWANGDYDRRPARATDLVRRKVRVIMTGGGPPAALAAKAATSTSVSRSWHWHHATPFPRFMAGASSSRLAA